MNPKDLTIEQIEEKLKETGFKESITDHGNGWYTIDAPGMTVKTNKAGLELFKKLMIEEVKKSVNDRTK